MVTGFITAAFGCMAVMFGPKLYLIYTGAKVDENFGIIRNSTTENKKTFSKKVLSKAISLINRSSQLVSGQYNEDGKSKYECKNSSEFLEEGDRGCSPSANTGRNSVSQGYTNTSKADDFEMNTSAHKPGKYKSVNLNSHKKSRPELVRINSHANLPTIKSMPRIKSIKEMSPENENDGVMPYQAVADTDLLNQS